MSVGKRIREVREGLGMSQVDFAKAIGVTKQTLYKYENDIITNIPSDKIEAAAKMGNISPAVIMGWEDDRNSKQQEFYTNPETEKITEGAATNRKLRALFSMQCDMAPEEIDAFYNLALTMKQKAERLDQDDPC